MGLAQRAAALWVALQLLRTVSWLLRWSGAEEPGMEAAISGMPEDAEEALALLKELGYGARSVWRIEDDRILAVDHENSAFTVRFEFSDEDVRAELMTGWPL